MGKVVMKISIAKGMVNIDGEKIAYSNIEKMYESGNGHGLQLTEDIEHKRGEIIDLCANISDSVYELYGILNKSPSPPEKT